MHRPEGYTSLLDNNSENIFVTVKKFLSSQDKVFFYAVCVLYVALIILTPYFGHSWDNQCWSDWSCHILKHGIGDVYSSYTDYPPLIHYFLWAFANIMGDEQYLRDNFKFFRMFVLLIEFAGAFFVVSQSKNYSKALIFIVLIVCNPAIFYDNILWGQTDGILTTLILISFIAAANKQVFTSFLFYLLAFNFKLQSGVFLPLIVLINFPEIKNNVKLKGVIKGVLILIAVEILILMPFIVAGKMHDVVRVFKDSFSKFPIVTMNAYNFWVHRYGKDLNFEKDTIRLMGVTLKSWGLIMFMLAAFFALWPFFLRQIRAWLKKNIVNKRQLLDDVLLTASLVNLLFFYLPTEMHERYSYPGLFFMACYSFRNNTYLIYFLYSAAFFLNMERVLVYLQAKNYHTLVFDMKFVSLIYLATIVLMFREIYKGYSWKKDFRQTFYR